MYAHDKCIKLSALLIFGRAINYQAHEGPG